jgi:hypothetical protein
MAGGEREHRGKKKESRFSDRPRPKPSKDELQSLALKREGFCKVSRLAATISFLSQSWQKTHWKPSDLSQFVVSHGPLSLSLRLVLLRMPT